MNNKNKEFFINDTEAEDLILEENKSSTAKVLYEDISKRGENTKHFRLPNGNFMAVMYDHPIHKIDPETGNHINITAETKETDTDYETIMERFKVRMPKTEGKDRFITVEKDGRELSWKFVPKNASRRKKSMATFSRRPKQNPWDIDDYPEIKYEKADTNTDLQYDILDDGVKESIILSKKTERKVFSFQLKYNGLIPVLSENKKTVYLIRDDGSASTESPEMKIPPAFMEDANKAFCDDIHYELRNDENETFLDLVLDSEWLSAPERTYPVIIDPRVELVRIGENKLKIKELLSRGELSADEALAGLTNRVGIDANGIVHRLYFGFSLPELAEGYKITKAGILLYQESYTSSDGTTQDYTVESVVEPTGKDLDWSSLTWNNVQNLTVDKTFDTLKGNYRPEDSETEIDMTDAITDWYAAAKADHIVLIRKSNETVETCCDAAKISYIKFHSLYANYYNRPKLYIEYSCTDMYSDHQKYHTFEVGRAGTGSINLFSGKLSFAHGDVSSEAVRLPLSVSHVYRHEYVGDNANSVNKYGRGWRLSTEQTLDVINKHGIYAVYTNAQGKRHYFTKDDNGNGAIKDDAGLGLTFKEECSCDCGCETTYSLRDDKGNKMRFNASGKLIQLSDVNGSISSLTYTNGNLTNVIDGSNNSATLCYTSNNKLDTIVDGNGRELKYNYDTAGDLVSITYPSSENAYANEGTLMTEFVYDTNHFLKKIIDYTGIFYTIDYDEIGRVKKLSSNGSKSVSDNQVLTTNNEVSNGSISFEYRSKSTAIKNDRTNVKTVYKFDENGRELSSYQDMTDVEDATKRVETTPTEICRYDSVIYEDLRSSIGKYRSLSVTMNNSPDQETNLIKNGFFESSSDILRPDNWSVVEVSTGKCGVSNECYISGKKSYHFSADHNYTAKYLKQTVDFCNCRVDGNVLVASAWAKTGGAVESNTTYSKFQLLLRLTYEDGKTEELTEDYERNYSGWQYVAIPFVWDSSHPPVKAEFLMDFSGNDGECYFTNARLVAVDGIITSNAYSTTEFPINYVNIFGETKEIKTVTTTKDGTLTTMDYIDENSDVVQNIVIDKDQNRFYTHYQYNYQHNVTKMQDYRGLVIEYTYNSAGKERTRKTYHKDTPNCYMFSEHTYKDKQFLASERDPRYYYNGEELKTTYEHDKSRNLLLKQTSVNGQEYNYSYDDNTDDLMSLSSVADSKTNENQFFYTRGYLTRVAHNGFNFGFGFDELGRSKTITVGDSAASTTLLSTNYIESGVNDIVETTYATNEKNTVTTDIFGNPIVSTYTDKNNVERIISNATYDSVGKVKQLVDNERGVCYNYTYDAKGNVTKIVETDTNGNVLATNTFVFDANERLSSKTYGAVGQTYRPVYDKNANGYVYPDNEILGITLDGKFTDKVTKDGLRRTSAKTFQVGSLTLFSESYGYLSTPKDGKTIATEIVSSVESRVDGTSVNSSTLNYTYDKAGNLETISNGTSLLSKYYYDGLNRLKREDNHTAGKTYVWDYDVGGNIIFKKEYALCTDVNLGACLDTKTYTYKSEGWRDRLDSFDGQTCTYDLMGNPLTYRGNTLTWTKVRRLASFGTNTFEYGANGIRYRKNNIVYTLDGNKILRESDGTKTLTYYHGGSGIVGFEYNGTDYYFRKNIQGDVTEIYTSAGLKVASYTYDAWGKVLAVNNYTDDNIGDINPIRYRSYYYDVETGLYYLNSRYYDPEVGRFINADTTSVLEDAMYDINGLNLYAYCDNNPVAGRDDEGDMSFLKKLAIAVAVVVVVAAVAATVAAATAATGGAAGAALCAVTSTFVGAAKGAAVGAIVGAATGAAVGGVQGAVEGYKETGTLEGTLKEAGRGALKGAVQGAQDGLISGMMSGAVAGAMNPSFCFVAGTAVLTTLGKKAIETIQVGDTIPCVDHITGEAAEKKVVSTSVNKVDRLIELNIDDEIIQCTETHPFQVKGNGWVDACDLNPGDILYTKDWNTTTVKSVSLLELDEPIEVYNFEVEDCHTYFVGECAVLVHNACQKHHIMSDKNKTYTPEFKKIADKYGLKLNGKVNGKKWNVFEVQNHSGRHTTEYHEFILKRVRSIDVVAGGNQDVFLKHFNNLANYVVNHPGILY